MKFITVAVAVFLVFSISASEINAELVKLHKQKKKSTGAAKIGFKSSGAVLPFIKSTGDFMHNKENIGEVSRYETLLNILRKPQYENQFDAKYGIMVAPELLNFEQMQSRQLATLQQIFDDEARTSRNMVIDQITQHAKYLLSKMDDFGDPGQPNCFESTRLGLENVIRTGEIIKFTDEKGAEKMVDAVKRALKNGIAESQQVLSGSYVKPLLEANEDEL